MRYLFGNLPEYKRYDIADIELSRVMCQYLANLAANGDPNGNCLPLWENYSPRMGNRLELGVFSM